MKMYMYEHWIQDKREQNEFEENFAVLTGSFSNPEAAQAYWKAKNPKFVSSDEDFAESLKMVTDQKIKPIADQSKILKKRQRKLLNKDVTNG